MPRPPRSYTPDTLYHLIARGVRRQTIFHEERDFRFFLRLLRNELDGHQLLAYCLMPNHLHLLVRNGETPLSEVMHRLLGAYARYFNRRMEAAGHVFQGRHHARHCATDGYVRELLRYIHLNPVRAGLTERPHDYPWSSMAAHLGWSAHLAVDTALALSVFGSRDAFLQFLAEPLGELAELRFREIDALVHGRRSAPEPQRPFIQELACIVAGLGGVDTAELWRGRRPEVRRVRVALVRLAVSDFGYRQREVARVFGRSETAISRWAHQGDGTEGELVTEARRLLANGAANRQR